MALVHIDGFDHYGTTANMLQVYNSVGGRGLITTTPINVRTGTGALQVDSIRFNPGGVSKSVAPLRLYTSGVSISRQGTSNAVPTMGLYFDATVGSFNSGFCIASTGAIVAIGNGSTIGTSAINVFQPGKKQYFEAQCFVHPTAGFMIVKCDDVVVLNLQNVNTGNYDINFITLGSPGNESDGNWYYDDFYITNNTGPNNTGFLSPIRARTLYATADILPQDWVPDTGTVGFSRINKVPALDAASYIQANNVNDTSKFSFTALPANTNYISGIAVITRSSKDDNGTATYRCGIQSPNGPILGASVNPGTGWSFSPQDIIERNPLGTIWSYGELNSSYMNMVRTA